MTSQATGYLADIPLILGMMRLLDHPQLHAPKTLAAWIESQLERGLDVFDHADIYGDGECERLFGEALAAYPGLRDKIRIITKTGIVLAHQDTSQWQTKHYRAEAEHVSGAIDRALGRLRVEQVDTFLIHRPDPLMDAEPVARVLEEAVSAGKVRHIGVSNFRPEQWRWLQKNTDLPLVCNQAELSLAHAEPLFDGTHEAQLSDRLRWLAWSPLGGGKLAGHLPGKLLETAREQTGLSETSLAIAWISQIPGQPIPVLGSMNDERIKAALEGCNSVLPRPLWFALLEAVRGRRVP